MPTLKIHPLREHPPMQTTVVQFVYDGLPSGWPWISGAGGMVFHRQGQRRGFSWGEVIDWLIDAAADPDMDDTLPEGWVRLVPETTDHKQKESVR